MTDKDKLIYAKAISSPSGYATAFLRIKLHPKQKEVLDSLFDGNMTRVIARCGNGTGKTSTIITCAILYSLHVLNAQVISTSATYRQGVSQLIPSLKQYSHLYPEWRFLDASISIGGIDKYLFFSTDDEGRFQGFHSKPEQPLLIIVDEAGAINESIFRAIDRCQPSYLLMAGSPLGPDGYFYEAETNSNIYKHFKHFIIKQLDCKKSDGYWIEDRLITEMIDKWGVTHPLVLSSVYAEFASATEGAIITLSQLNDCINNPPEHEIGKRQVGIDVAAGSAENVIFLRMGNKLYMRKAWRQSDTMSACGEIVIELEKMKKEIGLKASECYIDVDGLGVVIYDRLRELSWAINAFHGGAKARDEVNYANQISEAWIDGCKKIIKKEIIIPNDSELKGQLLGRKHKLNSSGKMQLESKKDMQGPSPDRADAMMMALADTVSSGVLTTAKAIQIGQSNYSHFQYF